MMLVELRVRDLGVIQDVTVELGPGMTALTGETGAGKTLLVEALELVLGGRSDPDLVRPGADQCLVEARFELDDGQGSEDATQSATELILARSVRPSGPGTRSRAWVDGRMAPVGALAELGASLVDLHGQHAHQSLLAPAAQRHALDVFAGVDLSELERARRELRAVEARLAELGGDEHARARQVDLLRYQLSEIEKAAIEGPDEDERLGAEQDRLSEAAAHRDAAAAALAALAADGGACDQLGQAAAALAGRSPLESVAQRLAGLQAEAADVAADLRSIFDTWEDDPERLDEIRLRRQVLRDLRRKYGETLADVLSFAGQARRDLLDLESVEARATELEVERERLLAEVARAEAAVGKARREAASALAEAVESRLRDLAMPRARLQIEVGEDPGDAVTFLLGANPGEPLLPLSKVASGGELARAMLGLRLVLKGVGGPRVLVFDEVDAGIGGEAALAVGRALARLSRDHQVLVVTHLAQVAAFANWHLSVKKAPRGDRTVAEVHRVEGEDRVMELARMLSGHPGSSSAQQHAREILADAAGG